MSGRACNFAVGLVVGAVLLANGQATAASGSGTILPDGVLEELEGHVVEQMTAQHVPGLAYVVIQGDQVVDVKAFGVRRLGGDPVTFETVFEIGSASKAFTATLLAMVVDDGKLSWDDRVVDHLPEFAMHDRWVTREIRVADLVCQRSGMPEHSLDGMALLGFTREDIIHAVRFVEPVTSFRSTFGYQNNLWLVAAALVEQKSGFTWEDNLDRRIFGPLGMASTTASPEVVATLPNRAAGHFWLPIVPEPPQEPKSELVAMPADWPYRHWLDIAGPAGSIRSTVLDLAQWVRFQINLGVVDNVRHLKATSVAHLQAPKTLVVAPGMPTADGDSYSYASGWMFQTSHRHPLVWHNGASTGMHSIVGYIPEAGVGLAMLTNEPKNKVPEGALYKLADLVLGLPVGATSGLEPDRAGLAPGRQDGVIAMGPPLPLERYVGTYTNQAYGPFEVRVHDGQLEMVFGPKRFVGVLQPVSGNTFRMVWPGWTAEVSTVTFTVPAGHSATKMAVEFCGDVRGGEFVRQAGGAGH